MYLSRNSKGVSTPSRWNSLSLSRHCQRNSRGGSPRRSEEHTSELQSPCNLVCRLLLEKKKKNNIYSHSAANHLTLNCLQTHLTPNHKHGTPRYYVAKFTAPAEHWYYETWLTWLVATL